MKEQRHSIAGPEKGVTDPKTIHMYNLEEGDDGAILIWDGNEHTRAKTWISGDEDAMIDLEDAR